MQRIAMHCNTLPHSAPYRWAEMTKAAQHTATHCIACIGGNDSCGVIAATHSNALQHTATHCNTLHRMHGLR